MGFHQVHLVDPGVYESKDLRSQAIEAADIGKAIELRAGTDVMILNTGNTLPEAVGAADLLAETGISA